MNQLTPEQRKQRIKTIVQIIAFIGTCLVLGPLYLVLLHGMAALVALGAVFTLGFVAINFIPWFSMMIANWKLKAIKYEASKNPVETLQNNYNERMQSLTQFREYIRNFAGEVKNFGGKLEGFKQDYPNEKKFDEQYTQMQALLEFRKHKYEEAKGNLALFEKVIAKSQAMWDMAQAAAKMNSVAGVDNEEFIQKLSSDTALDAVQKSMNNAFADLEVSLMDEKGTKPIIKATVDDPKQLSPGITSNDPLDLDIDAELVRVPVSSKRK